MNRSGRPISRECKQFSNRLQLSANDLGRRFFFFLPLRKVHIKTELIAAECHLLGFHLMEMHWVKKRKEGKTRRLCQCNSSFTSQLRGLQLCSADGSVSLQEHELLHTESCTRHELWGPCNELGNSKIPSFPY